MGWGEGWGLNSRYPVAVVEVHGVGRGLGFELTLFCSSAGSSWGGARAGV